MENQLVVLINHQDMTQIQIALHILRKGDVKHLIMTQFVFLGIPHARGQREQVTRGLDIRLKRRIALGDGITETNLGDKQILVVITQDSVTVVVISQILIMKRL